MLNACCKQDATAPRASPVISLGLASPRILRAGEHVDFLSLDLTPEAADMFKKLALRDYIRTRVCYCSVFDECWIKEGGDDLLRKD